MIPAIAQQTYKGETIMRTIKLALGAAAVAFTIVIALPAISLATAISIGNLWGEFSFGSQGSFADACTLSNCSVNSAGNSFFLDAPPWTFTGPGFLIVQDAFRIGDQFRVFDGVNSIGDTSAPIGSSICGENPVACFADANASRGIFTLGSGFHSFTIEAILSPFGAGAAYLCIDSGQGNCGVGPIGGDHDVPEPDSMVLLALSLVAAYCWAMRQRISECYIRIRSKYTRRR
jgi:hypothetical protein